MLANPNATKRPKNHENHFVKEIVAFTLSPNLRNRVNGSLSEGNGGRVSQACLIAFGG